MKLKQLCLTVITALTVPSGCAYAQDVALKTNALYWATTTPNLALEISMSRKITAEIAGAYNPWTFSDDRKMRCWLAQPEVKWWFCEKFEGHFVGVHIHGGQFFGGFRSTRYDGWLAGAGLSYGYDWILSPHWNLEAEIGLGYAYLSYDKGPRVPCRKCMTPDHFNYVGLTKAALSIAYIF